MYIRTKNMIYQVECETFDKKGYYIGDYGVIFKEQVIKQADTIEELCDRFVVMDKETKEVISIVSFLAYAKLWSSCKFNVYGAIWCEWGLKYVSKMDSDGKLELI